MKNLKKKLQEKIKEERGSEALQALLLSGIALVLVVLIFFPTMKGLFTVTVDEVVSWWDTESADIFNGTEVDLTK